MTIAVGFVIDDFVIIVENISRRVEAGEAPLDAAVKGTRQLGFTVISIAVALVAALIPILFMPDVVGRLFREFGLTLVAAIGTSTAVALTLTPMMCGQLLLPAAPGRKPVDSTLWADELSQELCRPLCPQSGMDASACLADIDGRRRADRGVFRHV